MDNEGEIMNEIIEMKNMAIGEETMPQVNSSVNMIPNENVDFLCDKLGIDKADVLNYILTTKGVYVSESDVIAFAKTLGV